LPAAVHAARRSGAGCQPQQPAHGAQRRARVAQRPRHATLRTVRSDCARC
jgi:hypothetical protein